MCGKCWWAWDGVRSGPQAGPGSGMRNESGIGRRGHGLLLKKSPAGRAYDRLRRRERTEPAAAPLPDVGAEGADAGLAVQLQLEEFVGGGWSDAAELLLPVIPRSREERASGGFPGGFGATHPAAVDCGLGWVARAPQPPGPRLYYESRRLDSNRIPSSLRTGVEPGRVHLGLLEAARIAQRLPKGFLESQPRCAPHSSQNAPPTPAHHRLLETSFFMAPVTLYYAGVNNFNLCYLYAVGRRKAD